MESEEVLSERERISAEEVLSNAANSSEYHCFLRRHAGPVFELEECSLRAMLLACGVNCSQLKNRQDCVNALKDYVDSHIDIDVAWKVNISQTGEKRSSMHSNAPPLSRTPVASTPKKKVTFQGTTSPAKPGHIIYEDFEGSIPVTPETQAPPSPAQARRPSKTQNEPLSLCLMLEGIVGGIDAANGALSEAIGILQLLAEGKSLRKERTMEGLVCLKCAQAATKGLGVGLQAARTILNTPGSIDPLLSHQLPRQTVSGTQSHMLQPSQSPSYAMIASMPRPNLMDVSKSKRNATQKLARKQIAIERHASRDDSRSLRLKSVAPRGILNPGSVARRVAWLCDYDGSTEDLVEEVRTDSRGVYYVQLCSSKWEEATANALSKTDEEATVELPDLGRFYVYGPTVSQTVGKRAVVITGVPISHDPMTVMSGLWSSNKDRWNLPDKSGSAHLALPTRLNRRLKDSPTTSTCLSSFSQWIPSKSVRIHVSQEIYSKLTEKPGSMYVIYDYAYLTVKPYSEAPKICDNCGVRCMHSAGVCRKPTCCRFCKEGHPSSECPSKTPPSDPIYEEMEHSSHPVTDEPRSSLGTPPPPTQTMCSGRIASRDHGN